MSRIDSVLVSWKEQLDILKDVGNTEAARVLDNCIMDVEGGTPLSRLVTMWEGRLDFARRMHSVEEEYVLENVIHDIEREYA